MPRTKSRRRSRARATGASPAVGKIAYRVIDRQGRELEMRSEKIHALVRAQRIAEFGPEDCLEVESAPVFGPPCTLYRVCREEGGVVVTYIISEED